jgi:hypothetical protein
MKTNEETQPRHIDSGKWANKEQTSPEIALNATEPDERQRTRPYFNYTKEVFNSDPRRSREGSAALLAEVEATIRTLRVKNGLSDDQVQDAIGDTMLDLTNRISRGRNVQGGLVQIAATAVCSRYVNGPIRHENARAIRILKARISEIESSDGRHVSTKEIETLAVNIRTGTDFDPRHRPIENFHLIQDFVRPTSFSQYPDTYVDTLMHEHGASAPAADVDSESSTATLAAALESKEINRAEAIRQMWTAIAEDQGAPQAKANNIPRVHTSYLTAQMKDGGVLRACRDHHDGVDSRATNAFFAPFGKISAAEQDAVVELMVSRPAHAEHLWASAMMAATKSTETERLERAAAAVARGKAVAARAAARDRNLRAKKALNETQIA